MKLKAIIATLALFVTTWGTANAALTGASGNNLAFAYWNGADTSYVLDLGVSVADAIAGTAGPISTNVVTDINTALGGGSITDTSTGFWTILGLPGTERADSSFITGAQTGSEPNATAANQVDQAVTIATGFLDATLTSGASSSTAADGNDYWAAAGGYQGTFNGFFGAGNGQPGQSLDVLLYEITSRGGFNPGPPPSIDPPSFASLLLGTAILDAAGNLNVSFSQVPVPAAVWLFGSAIAAFLGFGRRKTAPQQAA